MRVQENLKTIGLLVALAGTLASLDSQAVGRFKDNHDGTITDIETGAILLLDPQAAEQFKGRFKDNHDGTITDAKTGLIWLENANCFGRQDWNDAKAKVAELSSGTCGLSDGSYAGQWWLPSRKELETLVVGGATKPALPSNHPFNGVQSDMYWSSTPFFAKDAWYVDFYSGSYGERAKHFTFYVWPVRGVR